MAVNRSQRMAIVEKVALQREDQAAKALSMARQQMEMEHKRLEELKDYQDDYNGNLRQEGRVMTGMELRNFQYFTGQLELIVNQQKQQIDTLEGQIKQIQEKWQELYIRRKSIGSIVDKIKLEEWVVQEKKEQKAMDELVNQLQQANKNNH
jgi:flagellar protein FliJ